MKFEFSLQIFEKYSDVKFHENPSSGNRVVPCSWTDTTNLLAAFRSFANVLKNDTLYPTQDSNVSFTNLRTDSDCLTNCVYCSVQTEL